MLPNEILAKVYRGEEVTPGEARTFNTHPTIGHDLIVNIPRLRGVAEMIRYQEKHYNGQGFPEDDRKGTDIPLGARILHAALYFDSYSLHGKDAIKAVARIKRQEEWFDPIILKALVDIIESEDHYEIAAITLEEMTSNMILVDDVVTGNGALVIPKGQELTAAQRTRLKNFAKTMDIREPIRVLLPHSSLMNIRNGSHADEYSRSERNI